MTADVSWEKIDRIFPLVADLPVAEREELLRELCAGDEVLRRQISSLLAVDEKAEKFIETPVFFSDSLSKVFSGALENDNPSTLALTGRQIGAYRVVRKLGAGGMGAVYLAERADGEFRKKAAIKLVKNGADTAFNLRRFRHERQILATLEHSFIARLLDGGTTEDGSPYFAMEYVEGKTLFDFCAERNLNLNECLSLFRQICAAVSYAHEKGVVHRDIKPGNILITPDGTPKLLDFGIAKILDANLIQESICQTETMLRQMTPEYAAPEQITGEEITHATDVYSLGVILYELLTGARPYKFSSRAPHEIARVICEEKVADPKFKFQTANANDLSFIVLKTLRKNPAERYVSVAELDRDIERFLENLSISTGEERRRFSENPVAKSVSPVGSGGTIVSLAVAPFRVVCAETNESVRPLDASEFWGIGLADALTTRLSVVRQIAVRPTGSVMRLAENNVEPDALGRELNVDFVLTGHILSFGDQLRVSAQLLRTDDNSVLWARQFDESETNVFRLQDSISERVAASLVPQLTAEEQRLLHFQGTKNAEAYEAYLRGRVFFHNYTFGGIGAAENCFALAIKHDPNFALAHSALADFYNLQTIFGLTSNHEGFARAKKSARRAIELDSNLAEAYTALAFTTWAFDWDFAEAERLFQKSIRLNPNYAHAHEWYAFLLSVSERHEEAVTEMRRAERLDPNSPALATMFALVFYNARRYEESLEKSRRALEFDPSYYIALQSLGWICPRLGRFDEAIEGCRRAVLICDQQALNKFSLALALIDAGQTAEARVITAELEDRRQKEQVPAYYLALLYANLGEDEKAFEWLDEAVKERGYYTLRMRVEPRLDRLRSDSRFAERLEKIKPLPSAKTTGNFYLRATEKFALPGKSKARKMFAAATLSIFVVLIAAAANFKISFLEKGYLPLKIVFFKKDAPLGEHQAAAKPASGHGDSEQPRTTDAVADELYLAGKRQMDARTNDGINKAIEFFTEAGKHDPNFALAFSGLADAHMLRAEMRRNPADYKTAEEYALKALALNPDLAEARVSLGMAVFKTTKNLAAAEKHFLRAAEIDPSLAVAHHWYSVILEETGKIDQALREIEIAARLEPDSAVIQHSLAELYMKTKRYDEAIAHFDKAIEIDHNFTGAYFWKSLVQQYQGKYDEALETYRKARIYGGDDEMEPLWLLMQAQTHAVNRQRDESLKTLNRFFQSADYRKEPARHAAEVALVYNLLGDFENAVVWLEKYKIEYPNAPASCLDDPRFANLRGDARFARLAEN